MCLFIIDPEHQFVDEQSFPIVSVFFGHRVVLPCAVTDPAINVTLQKDIGSEDLTRFEGVTFDPIEGFIVEYPYYIFSGIFHCIAEGFNDTKDRKQLYLKYQGRASPIFLEPQVLVFPLNCT